MALQPKAPFIGDGRSTSQKYQEQWITANRKNWPYLPYEPDTEERGAAPQRVAPAVSSQGITEGIALAAEDMKAVIGIYDAGLGARSNETSGKAILARQREGDIGSYVYIDNWLARDPAHRHHPHRSDPARLRHRAQIRIMGEDGKIDLKWINKPQGMEVIDPSTGEVMASSTMSERHDGRRLRRRDADRPELLDQARGGARRA